MTIKDNRTTAPTVDNLFKVPSNTLFTGEIVSPEGVIQATGLFIKKASCVYRIDTDECSAKWLAQWSNALALRNYRVVNTLVLE